jgi:hypothetical protein
MATITKAYLQNPEGCPLCRSRSIRRVAEPTTAFAEFRPDRIGGRELENDLRCNDCGGRWVEHYALTSIEVLQESRGSQASPQTKRK